METVSALMTALTICHFSPIGEIVETEITREDAEGRCK